MSKKKTSPAPFEQTAYQRAELSAFRRMLTISEGTFSLSIAVCNSPVLRDHIIEHLTGEMDGIQVVRIQKDTDDIFDFACRHAADGNPRAVFLADVEKALDEETRERVLQGLNVSRELWRSRYPCPVVFWLAEYATELLSAKARDLWSWVSHNFEFVSEQSTAMAGMQDRYGGDLMLTSNLDVHEKHFRVAELEQRVADIGEEPKGQLRQHALLWLNELSYLYQVVGQLDKAEKILQRALTWAGSQDRKWMAVIYHMRGLICQARGDYDKALDYYERSRTIAEELGDRAQLSKSLHQIGMIHQERGDYDKALDYYERSRTIKEELGDRAGLAGSLYQIGMIHEDRGHYDKALDYYERARTIVEELGDRAGLSKSLHHIGIIHQQRGHYDKALDYYERSRTIREELGDRAGLADSLHQIGMIHQQRGHYDKALDYYERSRTIKEELGDRAGLASSHGQMGVLFAETKRYPEAFPHLFAALSILSELGSPAAKTAVGALGQLRQVWGAKNFDKAWRARTGQDVAEGLKSEPGEAQKETGQAGQ